jgi:hypothetical protein
MLYAAEALLYQVRISNEGNEWKPCAQSSEEDLHESQLPGLTN